MFRPPSSCVLAILAGLFAVSCATEGEKSQRAYQRYLKESLKAKQQRQKEYREWRQKQQLPPESAPASAEGQAPNQGDRYDVTIEPGPVSAQ